MPQNVLNERKFVASTPLHAMLVLVPVATTGTVPVIRAKKLRSNPAFSSDWNVIILVNIGQQKAMAIDRE